MAEVNITHGVAHNSTESGDEVKFFALPSLLTILIGVVIVVGNAITLLAIKSVASFRTAPDFYLSSLAVADGLVGITALSKIYTYFGASDDHSDFRVSRKYSCLAVLALASTSVMASTLSLALVALDRCLSVSHPFLYKSIASKKRTKQIILGAWLCSVVYGLLLVFFNTYSKQRKCLLVVQVDIWYFRYLTTSLSLIGISVSVISYCKIGQILLRNQNKRVFSAFVHLCCLRREELLFKSRTQRTSIRCSKTKKANPKSRHEMFARKELFPLSLVWKKRGKFENSISEKARVMKRENWRTIQMTNYSSDTQENIGDAKENLPSPTMERHKVTYVHHYDNNVYNDQPEAATSHAKKDKEIDPYSREIGVSVTRQDVMDKSLSDTGIYTSSMDNVFLDFPHAKSCVPVKKREGETRSDKCRRVARSKSLPNLKYSIKKCPWVECRTRGQCAETCPREVVLKSAPSCPIRVHLNEGEGKRMKIVKLSSSVPCDQASTLCLQAYPTCLHTFSTCLKASSTCLQSSSPCQHASPVFPRASLACQRVSATCMQTSSNSLYAYLQQCRFHDLAQNTLSQTNKRVAPPDQAFSGDIRCASLASQLGANLSVSAFHFENRHKPSPIKNSDPGLNNRNGSRCNSCCSDDVSCERNLSGLSRRKSLSDPNLARVFLAKESARVIKVIFFTQMLFIVCLAPGFFLCLLYGLTDVPVWLINWAPFTAFLNSAMNIFVYASCKSRYRAAIWSILKCGLFRSKRL